MIINEPVESYTMMLGFFLNNRIWDLMLMTGVVGIPILSMVVKSVTDAYTGGDDEGDRGSMALRFIEVGTIRIVLMMIFFMIPLGEPLNTTTVTYNNYTCNSFPDYEFIREADRVVEYDIRVPGIQAEVIVGSPVNEAIDLSVGGLQPRPPIMIGLVQNYSTKATNAISSTIPCVTDILSVGIAIGELDFKKQDTADLFGTFIAQCYGPSFERAKISTQMSPEEIHDSYWVGAPYFTGGSINANSVNSVSGVYWNDNNTVELDQWYYRERINRLGQTNPSYPAEITLAEGKVYPQCGHLYDILEGHIEQDYAKEIEELESITIQGVWHTLNNLYSNWFGDPQNNLSGLEVIVKRLTDIQNNFGSSDFKRYNPNKYAEMMETLNPANGGTALLKSVGALGSGVNNMIDAIFIKMLANPTIAMVQCLVYIVTPILLLLSGYSVSVAIKILATVFALEFTFVIFEICDWFSKTLMMLSFSDYSYLSANSQGTVFAIFSATQYAYMILPAAWMVLLGYVGVMGTKVTSATTGQGQKASGVAKDVGSKAAGKVSGSAMKAGKK